MVARGEGVSCVPPVEKTALHSGPGAFERVTTLFTRSFTVPVRYEDRIGFDENGVTHPPMSGRESNWSETWLLTLGPDPA